MDWNKLKELLQTPASATNPGRDHELAAMVPELLFDVANLGYGYKCKSISDEIEAQKQQEAAAEASPPPYVPSVEEAIRLGLSGSNEERAKAEILQEAQKDEAKPEHTPGPWRWALHPKMKSIELMAPAWCVMGFARWGMDGATPKFLGGKPNMLRKAVEFATPIKGREHHDWELEIDHPNARLIAAAPDLLAACEYALEYLGVRVNPPKPENIAESFEPEKGGHAVELLSAAIAKARGKILATSNGQTTSR